MRTEDGTETVLVVDDDPINRAYVARTLTTAGFRTGSTADGEQAIQRLAVRSYDIVVTDIQMPRVNGLELLEFIRLRFPDTAVILMTGSQDERIREAALVGGAVAFLEKPVDKQDLTSSVTVALWAKEGACVDESHEQKGRAPCMV